MCQVVANAARSLALCVRTEVPFAGKERPADIHISPWHEGYPVAVDLTAIHALPLSTRRLSSSSRAAVSQAERDKLARYAHIFDNASTTFVPCCVDVFGTIGPLGMSFLRELGTRLDALTDSSLDYQQLPPSKQLLRDLLGALHKHVGVVLAGFMAAWRDEAVSH